MLTPPRRKRPDTLRAYPNPVHFLLEALIFSYHGPILLLSPLFYSRLTTLTLPRQNTLTPSMHTPTHSTPYLNHSLASCLFYYNKLLFLLLLLLSKSLRLTPSRRKHPNTLHTYANALHFSLEPLPRLLHAPPLPPFLHLMPRKPGDVLLDTPTPRVRPNWKQRHYLILAPIALRPLPLSANIQIYAILHEPMDEPRVRCTWRHASTRRIRRRKRPKPSDLVLIKPIPLAALHEPKIL